MLYVLLPEENLRICGWSFLEVFIGGVLVAVDLHVADVFLLRRHGVVHVNVRMVHRDARCLLTQDDHGDHNDDEDGDAADGDAQRTAHVPR